MSDTELQPPAQPSHAGRYLLFGFVALLLIAGVILTIGLSHRAHTIKGTMTVHEDVGLASGSCSGTGGYSDIRIGTEVVVKDENNKVLATGQLTDGSVTGGACVFSFSLADVPDANFYQVEVSHRGQVTYSKAVMEAQNWEIGVELGN